MKILIMISRRKKGISCVDSRTEKKIIWETEWKTKENSKTVKTIFVKQSDTTNLWNQINKKKKEMICEIKWGKKLQVEKKN